MRLPRDTKSLVMKCVCLLALQGCLSQGSEKTSIEISQTQSPAGPESGEPYLVTGADSRLYMTWIQRHPAREGHSLQLSRYRDGSWLAPNEIAHGKDWFVNWADFPSLVVAPDGTLAAHWLAKSGKGTYAYDVNVSQSMDSGQSWSEPLVPHDDGTPTEHGFVSMLPWPENKFFLVWLDGRNFAGGNGHGASINEMTLRGAILARDGTLTGEIVLDSRVCECCQTSAALTDEGPIIVYRDRSEDEIRDISVVKWKDGAWTQSRTVHDDGWQIEGCPVNGPVIRARGNRIALAWFTASGDSPQVKIAFSHDGGKTFVEPFQLNRGEALGRVDLTMLPDGDAVISWLESTETAGRIEFCRIRNDGTEVFRQTLTDVDTGRATGFPQLAYHDGKLLFAWTEIGKPSRVLTAEAAID